ncbi:MAG: hypothetical protein HY675_27930 [Chloroflexi bacterium]|nr:hypothetical protein [Candidatus Methylomirabilis oxyfera]MBI4322340.1 hypothetical protein [Chloroflexota bacterium]
MRRRWAAILLIMALAASGCEAVRIPASAGGGATGVVATIVEPDDGSGAITEFIAQARSSVDVGVYLLSDRGVLDALRAARQRGAVVRVMLEEHPFGGGQGNATVYRQLGDAGIQAKWGNQTFRLAVAQLLHLAEKPRHLPVEHRQALGPSRTCP